MRSDERRAQQVRLHHGMSCMKIRVAAFALLMAAGGGAAPIAAMPSGAWRKAAGSLSPQYRVGSCVYRVWYGNLGSTPFAKVRLYSGDCDPVVLSLDIRSTPGGPDGGYHGLDSWSSGTDSCGSYFEKQTVGPSQWTATGETVKVDSSAAQHYRSDLSIYQDVYREC